MGIIDETEIEIIRKAPLNDPIEIKVGDFHLGIRRDEAKEIFVEALEE
jgi:ferrous iron transport protein A